MDKRKFLCSFGGAMVGLALPAAARAQSVMNPFIRWADLDVDPAQLDSFNAAGNTHAQAVLQTEPGVIAFHAVSERGNPARVRVLEMYRDEQAYGSHLEQPHFKQFLAATRSMVTKRQLHEVVPVRLGAKDRLTSSPLVRIAEIEVDPSQLQAYTAAVSEEIDDSIRLEPGVLTIYSVALAPQRNHLRFFEIYADDSSYRQHIESPHFRKYVETTKAMITSRKLFETRPVFLALKPH